MPIFPKAIARSYASQKTKVLQFPKGTFFCESKRLVSQIPKLGQTAVCVRLYLSASALNGKPNIRIAKRSITTIAKDMKCSRRTVERAIDTLAKHGFLMKKGKWFSLIEPQEEASAEIADTAKSYPQQLYLF